MDECRVRGGPQTLSRKHCQGNPDKIGEAVIMCGARVENA